MKTRSVTFEFSHEDETLLRDVSPAYIAWAGWCVHDEMRDDDAKAGPTTLEEPPHGGSIRG